MDESRFAFARVAGDPIGSRPIEFVERKGVGHPDTLCDGVAEAVSRRLSTRYRDQFGRVLHHNTDSVQLVAGRASPAFGGGDVETPIYVLLGGRATATFRGTTIPVHDLATSAAREYLLDTAEHLAPEHLQVESRIGEGSSDLKRLVEAESPRANDTSFGVGYAPLSENGSSGRSSRRYARPTPRSART